MDKVDKLASESQWDTWVGVEVEKHSGKPFKSGLKIGTPMSTTINPHSGKKAFLMDDGSIVDCLQVKPVEIPEQQVQLLAMAKGWRMIPNDEYAFDGYTIQLKKHFIGIPYWSDEYLCKDRQSAIKTLRKKI